MFVQASSLIIANVYQPYDAPLCAFSLAASASDRLRQKRQQRHARRGRLHLRASTVDFSCALSQQGLYGATWLFYTRINERREAKWSALTPEERAEYARTTTDARSQRLDFRFAT